MFMNFPFPARAGGDGIPADGALWVADNAILWAADNNMTWG
jgi:hypothetical protein